MNNTYQIYLISDSTGETLDRIYLANRGLKTSNIPLVNENSLIKIYEISKENV